MYTDDELTEIRHAAHVETQRLLGEMNERIRALGDAPLAALMEQLREILAKDFLVNGIEDWQRPQE